MERVTHSVRLLVSLFSIVLLLAACGGGGSDGGGEGSSRNLTLELGTPSTSPVLVAPSATATPVKFLSVISGSYYPEDLRLDEIDDEGNVVQEDVARLKDDGQGSDLHRGDRTYTTTLSLSSIEADEKFYRVRVNMEGEEIFSNSTSFWVSGCPVRSRPSNPDSAVFDSRSKAYIFSNELMVMLADGVTPSLDGINQLLGDVNGHVVGCIPSLNQFLVELDGNDTAEGVYSAISQLTVVPEVALAFPNTQVLDLPSGEQILCDGQECQWYLERIRAPQAWELVGAGDEQQAVAVIDFGVDCNHQELDCDGDRFNEDIIDHGTGVASLINARTGDGTDVVGVAWNTQLHPYSFLGRGGSQYKLSELISSAMSEESVKVINISAVTSIDPNYQIRDAVCNAIDSGRLVVAAAGNASSDGACQIDNIYPAKYNTSGMCNNGADLQSGLLVVGASDQDNNLAEWGEDEQCSNTLHVDLYAPGESIYTASAFDNYTEKNGTSYATPLAAGSAAVVWAARPSFTVSQVHDQLINNTSMLGQSGDLSRTSTSDSRLDGKPLLDLYLAVGGRDDLPAPDVVPNDFVFESVLSPVVNEMVESDPIVVEGIDVATPIDIEGGYYSIDGGPFTNSAGTVEPNQTVVIQVQSSEQSDEVERAEITIGGQVKVFEVATESVDSTPLTYDFFDIDGARVADFALTNTVTMSGINTETTVSVSGGELSIDGGAFTDQSSLITDGQTLQLRVMTPALPDARQLFSVNVGGRIDDIFVTTEGPDATPDTFFFVPEFEAELQTDYVSNTVFVTGINTSTPVSISGGEYSIDNGAFTNEASVLLPGQSLQVRQSSSWFPETSTYVTITVGTYSATYQVITLDADTTPESFSFTDVRDAGLDRLYRSNEIIVSGVNTRIPFSVNVPDVEVSINSAEFNTPPQTVRNGDSVVLRLRSSEVVATTVSTIATIGGVSAAFNVSTVGASFANPFSFSDAIGVELSSTVLSNEQEITGLNSPVAISIVGGEYSIDGQDFTALPGLLENNQGVRVRHTSADDFSTSRDTVLSIGAVAGTFRSTTTAVDSTPDIFILNDFAGVQLASANISNPITVSGVNTAVMVSVSAGQYRINTGPWQTDPALVNNGDSIELLATASDEPATTTDIVLTVGTFSDTYSVTTVGEDSVPDAFVFIDQTDVALNTLITSNVINVTGINAASAISVSGGEYQINGGAFTVVPGQVQEGDVVVVQITSSVNTAETVAVQLNIGGISDTFDVTTEAASEATSFVFVDQSDVALSTEFISNTVLITGLNSAVAISVSGGEYAIDGGAFTALAGTISNNQSVQVRVTSSAEFNTTVSAILDVDGVSDSFDVSTLLEDTIPDAFAFSDQTDVALNTLTVSDTINVSGINSQAPIQIANGEYSINGAAFTSIAGTVADGDEVVVRITSSADVAATVSATLNIGGVVDTFNVSTEGASLPDAFSFAAQTDVDRNTQVVSNSQTISGLNSALPISIVGGEYALNGGAFTATAGSIDSNDSVQVRVLSASEFDTQVSATLSVGSIDEIFSVRTLLEDITPDDFTFTDQVDVDLNATLVSSGITVNGINNSAAISVIGGEYRINSGAWTTAGGLVELNDVVELRVAAAAEPATSVDATLTISGVNDTFSVTTVAADQNPDTFSFVDENDVALNTVISSNTISISGINTATAISIVGGEYQINDGAFTSSDSTVEENDLVVVRTTSSLDVSDAVDAVLTVGSFSDTFTVTTEAATPANAFAFVDQNDVALVAEVISNEVTITGLNSAVALSITGGEYSIDGGPFTAAPDDIANNQSVRVRVTSSDAFDTSSSATLDIAGVSDTFDVRTLLEDTTPDAFNFVAQSDAQLDTVTTSNAITVTGINSSAAVQITNGEYRINGGGFTTADGFVSEDDDIVVRITSSSEVATTVFATLNVGGVIDTFNVSTEGATLPEAFSFTTQTNVDLLSDIDSNLVFITNLNSALPVTIENGEYAINGGVFTTEEGLINDDDSLQLRVISSAEYDTPTTATVSVGSVVETFTARTLLEDTTPDAFSFTDQSDIPLGMFAISNSITVTGINSAAPISVTGGQYRINSGTFTNVAGTVELNDEVELWVTASAEVGTSTDVVLNIGGITDTFRVTTEAASTPDAFSFTDQTDVALNAVVESDIQTIIGLNSPVAISITNGEFSIDGAEYTASPTTIENGQDVQVRVTASENFATAETATLDIAGVTDDFTVTTLAVDTVPNVFTFIDESDAALSTQYMSNEITVTGINTATSISIAGGHYRINDGLFTNEPGLINAGDIVVVLLTSSSQFSANGGSILTIGGINDTYSITTLAEDSVPDAFDFVDQSNVALGALVESNIVVIGGINSTSAISVSGGEYRVNAQAWTNSVGTVEEGDTVMVRVNASSTPEVTSGLAITIGGVVDNFNVTTIDADTTPNAFMFFDQTDIAPSDTLQSNSVTISGINTSAPISIVGGFYSIAGGPFINTSGTVNEGDLVTLQVESSSEFSTTVNATLTIGGISDVFSVTTLAADTVPDAFDLGEIISLPLDVTAASNTVVIAGTNSPSPVFITGGEYQIDTNAWTAAPGEISSGQSINVRGTTANTPDTSTNVTLDIGGVSDTFVMTTEAADTTPDGFVFNAQTDIALNTLVQSNQATITGINTAVPISVTNGEYQINSQPFTTISGNVVEGDQVRVRQTSSSSPEQSTTTSLTVGTRTVNFQVTTLNADTAPDAFVFTDVTDADLSTEYTSNAVLVGGINTNVLASVNGGLYSVNGGAFTSNSGNVLSGDSIRVRLVSSSANFATESAVTLTVGGVSDTYSVTTLAEDTVPESFVFNDRVGVALGTQAESNSVFVTGINSNAAISVTGGEYRIGLNAYTTSAGTIENGDTVRVRGTASSSPEETVNVSLNIGGVSDTFSITTVDADTTADSFSFTAQTDVALNTSIISNTITVTGINTGSAIFVLDESCTYSINGGPFVSSAGDVNAGDQVRVQVQSASDFSTVSAGQISIASVIGIFNVTTLAEDTSPQAFSFNSATDAPLNTEIVSNSVTITGINTDAAVSITNGQFRIDSGAWISNSTVISNNQSIEVRGTSSSTPNNQTLTTLQVGTESATFSITTEAEDTTPEPFAFTAQTNVALNTDIESNTVTVSGINTSTPISVVNGFYRINGGTYTAIPGNVSDSDTLQVRGTSSNTPDTLTSVTLTIGGEDGVFSFTTISEDTTPEAFSFGSEVGVQTNRQLFSNAITVSGINTQTPISISNGDYQINNEEYLSAPATVGEGDTVNIRLDSSPNYSTETTATLTIGGVSSVFSVTTEEDRYPDPMIFPPQNNVFWNQTILSNTINVTGMIDGVVIEVLNGEYSIDGGEFTSTTGTINAGQTVTLRVISAGTELTQSCVTLGVGNSSSSFCVTTNAAETTPPVGEILFPPTNSHTSNETVLVRGSASDASGIGSILVNGVTATSDDDFATWVADVPLSEGNNVLTAVIRDTQSNVSNTSSVTVRQGPTFSDVSILALDNQSNSVLSFDSAYNGSIISLNRSTGAAETLLDGGETPFYNVKDFTVGSSNMAYVIDRPGTLTTLRSVNLESGDVNTISQDILSSPEGLLGGIDSLVVDQSSYRLFASDSNQLIEIDIETGERTIISTVTFGALVFDEDRILACHPANDELHSIDPITGDSIVLYEILSGKNCSQSLAYDPVDNMAYFASALSGENEIISVNLTSGEQSVLSNNSTTPGDVNLASYVRSIGVDRGRNQLIVNSSNMLAVDLDTGERTDMVYSLASGGGAVVDPETDRVYALDGTGHGLYYVDLLNPVSRVTTASNDIAVELSDAHINDPRWLAVDFSRGVSYVFNRELLNIIAIDNSTGARSLITSNGQVDEHLTISGASSFALDEIGREVFVVDSVRDLIMAIDIDTGDRRVVSSLLIPNALNNISDSRGVALDRTNNRLLVLDIGWLAIIEVDLDTGARQFIGNPGYVNYGPWYPNGIFYDDSRDLIWFTDNQSRMRAIDNQGSIVHTISNIEGDIVFDSNTNNAVGIRELRDGYKPAEIDLDNLSYNLMSRVGLPNTQNVMEDTGAVVKHPSGNPIYVPDPNTNRIYSVDTVTGVRSIVSDNSIAVEESNVNFSSITHFDINTAGDTLYVSNGSSVRAIVAVDIASGIRTLVSDNTMALQESTIEFGYLYGIAGDYENDRLFVSTTGNSTEGVSIVEVNISTGVRHTIAANDIAIEDSSVELASGRELAFDEVNNRLIVTGSHGFIYQVALETGARNILFNNDMLEAAGLTHVYGADVTVDSAAGEAYIVSTNTNTVIRVSLDDGALSELHLDSMAGIAHYWMSSTVLDDSGEYFLSGSTAEGGIFATDQVTGETVIFSM